MNGQVGDHQTHSDLLTQVDGSNIVWVMMTVNTACDRLLSEFMFVDATVRDLFPSDIRESISYPIALKSSSKLHTALR